MWDEVHSNVGAQDVDISKHEVSDQKDLEFHLEEPDLKTDAFFRPGIDTLFFLST